MSKYLCPKCGKPTERGLACPRCKQVTAKRSHGTKTAAQERQREQSEAWRREYRSSEYQKARQFAISKSLGRCAQCGLPVANFKGGKWYTGKYGGVHHIKALSQGGTNDPANLVLLCVQCHNTIDAQRRRQEQQ